MDLDRQPEPDHALTVPFYPRFQPVLNQDSSHKKHSMQVFRGFHHPGIASACALTIGNFDGVHRGHQAMLALLKSEASHRGLPSCVMTFEPHPRDYFAAKAMTWFLTALEEEKMIDDEPALLRQFAAAQSYWMADAMLKAREA